MKLPEAQFIRTEITVRDMQLPNDVKLTRKSLVRWLALSVGLISPNESRTSVLAILSALFHFQLKEKRDPDVHDLLEYLGKGEKVNEKALRYHLFQLKKAGVIERVKGKYRFTPSPFSEAEDLPSSFEYAYKSRMDIAFVKIKEALAKLKELHK
ncbi:MAG: hypothetical protein ABIH99_04215 [Candidatus Micrarchaeota archaeon]